MSKLNSNCNASLTDSEMIILVDQHDNIVGHAEKLYAHQLGLCHRAFSIFIFSGTKHKLELLLQRRHHQKYHSPGLLTNSCCSHPRANETILTAANRRLCEELQLNVELSIAGSFHYYNQFENGLVENEYDYVLIGFTQQRTIQFNPQEIDEVVWVDIPTLYKRLRKNKNEFTVWFEPSLQIALQSLENHSYD